MAEELLHLVQRPPGVDQEARVAVAQIVQPHFLQPDLLSDRVPGVEDRHWRLLGLGVEEHPGDVLLPG